MERPYLSPTPLNIFNLRCLPNIQDLESLRAAECLGLGGLGVKKSNFRVR